MTAQSRSIKGWYEGVVGQVGEGRRRIPCWRNWGIHEPGDALQVSEDPVIASPSRIVPLLLELAAVLEQRRLELRR